MGSHFEWKVDTRAIKMTTIAHKEWKFKYNNCLIEFFHNNEDMIGTEVKSNVKKSVANKLMILVREPLDVIF